MAFPDAGSLLPSRILLIAAAALALVMVPSGEIRAGKTYPDPRWIAGAVEQKGEGSGNTVTFEVSGISFSARPLDTSEWEARLEKAAPGMGAAFRRHDGSEGPFQVFLLAVTNRSPEILRFQPGNTVRIVGDKQQDHILDYTDFYRYLMEEGKDPESLSRIHDLFFDTGISLERGGTIERLLFFKSLPADIKKKQLTLLFSSFQVGTETSRAALAWHAAKEKK